VRGMREGVREGDRKEGERNGGREGGRWRVGEGEVGRKGGSA